MSGLVLCPLCKEQIAVHELAYHVSICHEDKEMDERLSLLFNIPKEELWK